MRKRVLSVLMGVALCVAFAPAVAMAVSGDLGAASSELIAQADASVINAHIPKNVKVRFLGHETGVDGKKYLLVEASWDADPNVSLNELYPYVSDSLGGLHVIPGKTGQSVGSKASGAPADVRFKTKNGRSYYIMRLLVIGVNDQQFGENENGKYANGVKEGSECVFLMTARLGTSSGLVETGYSNPVEFVYSKTNVKQKAVFSEKGLVERTSLTAVKIKKLTGEKGSALVEWKKLTKKAAKKTKKVEIQYSKDKTFAKNVKTKRVNAKKMKATLGKLTPGKRYYVRIRGYSKGKDGVLNYSSWSAVKKVKAK